MPALPRFAPAPRALWLLVVMAFAALVLGALQPAAWIAAPAAAGALAIMVVVDAALAGRLAHFSIVVPADAEVGEPMTIAVSAAIAGAGRWCRPHVAIAADPRLAEGGRIELALRAAEDGGTWSGASHPAPLRRGTGTVARGWLRWQGPLGLAHRQAMRRIAAPVRVWPNIAPARGRALQVTLREATIGQMARRIRGDGNEFEALTEYRSGMDRRRIDWKSSARHARLHAREYEIERNTQVVFAFDCGQAMCEPIGGIARIDRAVTAALTTAWVALRGEDRVALFGFGARPLAMSPFVTAPHQFRRLQEAAAAFDYGSEDANYTLAMATLAARLQRRSLIVVFAEFTDTTGAELMIEMCAHLVLRHRVLFVMMRDEDLDRVAGAPVAAAADVARAVVAQGLIRQRALVLNRLRQTGVRVIEARWQTIGAELIAQYLRIKREGSIG